MVRPLLSPQPLHLLRHILVPLAGLGLLLSSCDREKRLGPAGENNRLKTDLDETGRKLSLAEKNLEVTSAEFALANDATAKARTQLTEKETLNAQQAEQLRVVQADLDTLKKRDAFVFAEIVARRQQGQSLIALEQFQRFLTDFPASPLAGYATAAIAELNADRARNAQRWAALVAPKRNEREMMKNFGDGLTTLAELAPVLKNKSLTQVIKFLGRPDRTFNEGTEIGYADKAMNPATGRPGMLVIGLDSGTVSTLRVEYSGRKMTP